MWRCKVDSRIHIPLSFKGINLSFRPVRFEDSRELPALRRIRKLRRLCDLSRREMPQDLKRNRLRAFARVFDDTVRGERAVAVFERTQAGAGAEEQTKNYDAGPELQAAARCAPGFSKRERSSSCFLRAAARWRVLMCPKPRISSGIEAICTASE